jgi:hypothetical protein
MWSSAWRKKGWPTDWESVYKTEFHQPANVIAQCRPCHDDYEAGRISRHALQQRRCQLAFAAARRGIYQDYLWSELAQRGKGRSNLDALGKVVLWASLSYADGALAEPHRFIIAPDHRPCDASEQPKLASRSTSEDRGSPHPCGMYGAARPGGTLDSTALGCRSLIRMGSSALGQAVRWWPSRFSRASISRRRGSARRRHQAWRHLLRWRAGRGSAPPAQATGAGRRGTSRNSRSAAAGSDRARLASVGDHVAVRGR